MNGNNGAAMSAANFRANAGRASNSEFDGEEMLPQLDEMLAPDEFGLIGDLGNEDDDDEFSPETAKLARLAITPRQRYMLWRLDRSIESLKALAAKSNEHGEERVPDEVWRRLGDEALGLDAAKGSSAKKPDAPSKPTSRKSVAGELAGIKSGLAILHEIALLQSSMEGEIATAKQHMDNAAKSAKSIASVSLRFGFKRPA